MDFRIRARALILDEEGERLLLVKHVSPFTNREWWAPPGGAVEDDESVVQCVEREVWEETGLRATADKVVYVREFIERGRQRHHLEVYLLCAVQSGSLTTANLARAGAGDEHFVKEVCFLSQDDLQPLTVFPEALKSGLWTDVAAGFPATRYLGLDVLE